ncbi:hypothetical protein JYU34_015349 [Plutella xylostella]|uniref:Uncharacterized protein n=1 Tax=Plutella xylostella TaxID=51655 RepID=A0ABQ7Q6Z0_PLUXY|nr:hypothetical protein JYU34_015349 [Plutella xylostella]
MTLLSGEIKYVGGECRRTHAALLFRVVQQFCQPYPGGTASHIVIRAVPPAPPPPPPPPSARHFLCNRRPARGHCGCFIIAG